MMPAITRIVFIMILLIPVHLVGETFDWPQWQGPGRDGQSQETGLLHSWPDGGPARRWLFDDCGAGYSGPAVADGRLYMLGDRNGECELIALDVNTGRELWATSLGAGLNNDWGDGPRGTPAVDDGRVYALSGTGTLICVQAEDGREVWRKTMQSLGGKVPFWGYAESVLVDGDKVLCTPGGAQGTIAALDKRTGNVIWQTPELTDAAHYASMVPAVFHGQPQYVQLLEKRLVGVSPDDGRLLWQVGWPGSVAVIPTPLIQDNRVFVTSGYGAGCMLVEVRPENEAAKVYENKRMKNHHGGVIRVGDYVYGYSEDLGWLCMDFQSGDIAWRERSALGKGAIGYADGKLYCVDEEDGNVVLVDASPQGWAERGRFTLSPHSKIRKPQGGIWTHPIVADGKLFLRDQELLYCYDVR